MQMRPNIFTEYNIIYKINMCVHICLSMQVCVCVSVWVREIVCVRVCVCVQCSNDPIRAKTELSYPILFATEIMEKSQTQWNRTPGAYRGSRKQVVGNDKVFSYLVF